MARAVKLKSMALDKGIPFEAGDVKGTIFGGPYRDYHEGTRRLVGVKMAEEIDHPHDISVPVEDFSIPTPDEMQAGVLGSISYMARGNDIYAGCMGGIGRTGLFMGCMAKVMIDFHKGAYAGFSDPVLYVRHFYKPHAIETIDQQAFVKNFNTEPALVHLDGYQWASIALYKRMMEEARTDLNNLLVNPRVKYVEKVVYLDNPRPHRSPWNRLLTFWKPD